MEPRTLKSGISTIALLILSLFISTSLGFSQQLPDDWQAEEKPFNSATDAGDTVVHGRSVVVPEAPEGGRSIGDDCSNPIIINLPGDLPFEDLGNYTCGRGNDLWNTCMDDYDSGEEIIYKLNVASVVIVDFNFDPVEQYSGIAIQDACGQGYYAGNCLYLKTGSSSWPRVFNYTFFPGTYYIMIDSHSSYTTCLTGFDLTLNSRPLYTYTSSGTFVPPAGVSIVKAQAWGGGGKGGDATGAWDDREESGGGGGGAYSEGTTSVSAPIEYTVTVGLGGSGDPSTRHGGDSWFGSVTTVLAKGGEGVLLNHNAGGAGGSDALGYGNGAKHKGGEGGNADGGDDISGCGGGGAGTIGAGGDATNGSSSDPGSGAREGGGDGGENDWQDGDGDDGQVCGGGGGGACDDSWGGDTDYGGDGGRGQVIVSWTCPTYSLDSVSGMSFCRTITSITLYGLDKGIYTVTYGTTNPYQSGLTASVNVDGSRTGSFTATGLTAAAPSSSTITITHLSSGSTPGGYCCGNDITSNNTSTVTKTAGGQMNVYPGTALDFDGIDDGVSTDIGVDPADYPFMTWEAWVYPTRSNYGDWQFVFSNDDQGWDRTVAVRPDTSFWEVHTGSGAWNAVEVDLDTWQHIAVVFDDINDSIFFYKNGTRYVYDGLSSFGSSNLKLNIGRSPEDQYYFQGKIDDVRIWDNIRTQQQIRESMHTSLDCNEAGLISYWNFNEGVGNQLFDAISGNNGTLINMNNADWITSGIPFGTGFADSQTETNGTVLFSQTGLSMDFTSQNSAEITASRIDINPNIFPISPDTIFNDQYWVVNRFDTTAFEADLNFTMAEDLVAYDESNPHTIVLYTRSSNSDTDWAFMAIADSVNAAANTATFRGVTGFSQFIVAKGYPPHITTGNFIIFNCFSINFNAIDVGSRSAPTFADLDGDGLLDLIVGESGGNLDHYEQDSINSTSFSLVTETFNAIDVGSFSTPAFTELDGDGLLDLIVGEWYGKLSHYEQDALNSGSFSLITASFNSIDVGSFSAPAFTDLDGDELLDLIVGENDGILNHYEQDTHNSASFSLVTETFNNIDVGGTSTPSFTDLDGDGLLDLIVGEQNGNLNHYEQENINGMDFGPVIAGDTSSAKSYTIKAYLLDDLFIECPEGYSVSLNESYGYTDSLIIPRAGGGLSVQVYVRFSPDTITSYNGSLVHTSPWATTQSIALSGRGALIDGFPGTALAFDGTSDYVQCGNTGSIGIGDELTLEAWVKIPSSFPDGSRVGNIIGNYGSSPNFNFEVHTNGILRFYWGEGPVDIFSTGIDLRDDTWHHVAVSRDSVADQIILYIDGEMNVDSAAGSNADLQWPLRIGSDFRTGGLPFNGLIEEVRLWNSARSQEQIRENMHLPLSGTETGLVSYWQFNDTTGAEIGDIISGNHGVLVNMDSANWVASTIPFGTGFADSQTETGGTVVFAQTGLSMDFTEQNSAEITASRIDLDPNVSPLSPDTVFEEQYWVVNRYDTTSFEADLSFTLTEDLTTADENNPSAIVLYTRASNSDSTWKVKSTADSVNAAANTATFRGITSFSQFIAAKGSAPLITLVNPGIFDSISSDFNSIDIGAYSSPTFTDLDGDGLLDLIVGEWDGNLNHYEQDVVNSLSFTLINENFNSIDIEVYSTPTFTDIDGDGLLDLIVGEYNGNLNHYEQNAVNSLSFILINENFNSIDIGAASSPAFTDLDGDGLLDLIIGDQDGNLNHYEQDALNSLSFSLLNPSFNAIDVGSYSLPVFTDIEGDGLLDLFIGEQDGNLNHYEQDALNSGFFSLITTSFNAIDVGLLSSPAFTDMNGDGLLDLIIGETDGNLNHFEQEFIDEFVFGPDLVGNSVVKTYMLGAKNLINDLLIECPEGYTVSLNKSSGYTDSLIIPPVGGSLWEQVFVCFNPDSVTYFNGIMTHSSAEAIAKNITLSGSGVLIDGFPGTALDFDGSSNYVDCGNDASFNIANNITVEAWVKPDSMPGNSQIIKKGNMSFLYWDAEMEDIQGHGIQIYLPGLGANYWEFHRVMDYNTWVHVAWTFDDSGNLTAYVNGELTRQSYYPGSLSINTNALEFAPSSASTDEYHGLFDEVRIWNVVRTTEEIRENMHLPLTGLEPGLVSYWQFNDSTETRVAEIISGNHGTLVNMDNSDWIPSTIPFGTGFADSKTETNGTVTFAGTGLSMDFISQNGAEITASRIDLDPNMLPLSPDTVCDAQYWVVNRYDTTSFEADLCFTLTEDLTTEDEANPSKIKLFARASNSDTAWEIRATADSVNAAANTATFRGITGFSQFIAAKSNPMISLVNPFDLQLITNNFDSIDVGNRSIPAFTDLDGDGLLDLIVGKVQGVLYHYEQDAIHSLDYTLLDPNYNAIDVGTYSAPTFTDLDGDGLLDLIVGNSLGELKHYEQDTIHSLSFTDVPSAINSISVDHWASPTFTDLDGDGLLDLIVGSGWEGYLKHYEQDAIHSLSFSPVTSTFNSISDDDWLFPTFTDLDEDGRLDLIVSTFYDVYHYVQDAIHSLDFTLIDSDINAMDVGQVSAPTFTNLDGDNFLDLIMGENGNLRHYEQDSIDEMDFGSVFIGRTSSPKSYTLRANNLPGDLLIVCPAGFSVSLNESSGYTNSLSISPLNGILSTQVYVRFEPLSDTSYSGNLIHSSPFTTTKNIALSGSGFPFDGFPGTALSFDGGSDYVQCGSSGSIGIGNEMTLEAWIKISSSFPAASRVGIIIGNYDHSPNFNFEVHQNGILRFYWNAGQVNALSTGVDLRDDTWHHVAVSRNLGDNQIILYIDGEENAVFSAGSNTNTQWPLRIGNDFRSGGLPFNGLIEEVRLWNSSRSEQQIREHMHIPVNPLDTGLISYWQLNDSTGTQAIDLISGNNGTLVNMDNADWVASTIPFGKGSSDSQVETNGNVAFTGTGLSMDYTSQNGAEITSSRININPNLLPVSLPIVFDQQYWVVNRYGSGSFDTDLSFSVAENLSTDDEANPSNVSLYSRPSNADTAWAFVTSAYSVNAATNVAVFHEISGFSQFIIGKLDCGAPDVPTLSVDTISICRGSSIMLSITTGDLNNAANWQWYAGSCGGIEAGKGLSLEVTPESTTNYFVRGEGGCVTPDSCARVTVIVTDGYAGTWLGNSTDWFSEDNWCGGVPTAASDLFIPSGLRYYPFIDASGAICHDITIGNTALLNISASDTLTVSGNWTGNSPFIPATGTVRFTGNGTFSVSTLQTGTTDITSYAISTFAKGMTPLSAAFTGPEGDDVNADIPIGFTFNYTGTDYTALRINTNGWVSLNQTGEDGWNNFPLFTTDDPAAAIAAWWDDLRDDDTSAVYYKTEGTAPNRVFTAEWNRVLTNYTTATARISFQLKLFETTHVFEFHYGDAEAGTHNNEGASIGAKDLTGGPGHFLEATTGSTTTGVTNLVSPADWPLINYRFTPVYGPYISKQSFNNLIIGNTGGTINFMLDTDVYGILKVMPDGSFTVSSGNTVKVME